MESQEQLQAWLTEARAARHDLHIGKKVVSATYYGRSVNYIATEAAALDKYIAELESKIRGRTRAGKPYFR